METSRSGFLNGSGRSRTALTTLKIAVFAPMPRLKVITATTVKPGLLRNMRAAYRKSCQSVCITCSRSNSIRLDVNHNLQPLSDDASPVVNSKVQTIQFGLADVVNNFLSIWRSTAIYFRNVEQHIFL